MNFGRFVSLAAPTLTLALVSLDALGAEPGEIVHPAVPWAVVTDDGEPRSLLERATGVHVPREEWVEPFEQEGMVIDAESLTPGSLTAMGLPAQPAFDFEPTPGILILAMDGVTLKPTCGGPQSANAALNCSPLVSKVTDFPAFGGATQKAAVLQKLTTYYGPYNLVLATTRPPDYVPYTLAVIGGSSGNAGYQNGTCGVANVACDGAKRNHVSLSFPSSCAGSEAEIAAQETAHNWGLEHTNLKSDLMYPYVTGQATKFVDQCMPISHATGSGVTQCTYVHEFYCPGGGGEEQNSHAELLGVFGARAPDDEKPQILAIAPADGSVFTTADEFTVTATLADNFNFLGVKWTWIEGVPADLGETYTRCTNMVCDADFAAWKPIDSPWDFLTLTKPPAGTYSFKVEAMDAYGNSVSQSITIEVMGAGDTGGTSGGSTSGGETDGGTSDAGTSGDAGTSDASGDAGTSGSVPGGTTSGATAGGDTDGADEEGCQCRSGAGGPGALVFVAIFGWRRRRR